MCTTTPKRTAFLKRVGRDAHTHTLHVVPELPARYFAAHGGRQKILSAVPSHKAPPTYPHILFVLLSGLYHHIFVNEKMRAVIWPLPIEIWQSAMWECCGGQRGDCGGGSCHAPALTLAPPLTWSPSSWPRPWPHHTRRQRGHTRSLLNFNGITAWGWRPWSIWRTWSRARCRACQRSRC